MVLIPADVNQHERFLDLQLLSGVLADNFFDLPRTVITPTMPRHKIGQPGESVDLSGLDFIGYFRPLNPVSVDDMAHLQSQRLDLPYALNPQVRGVLVVLIVRSFCVFACR